MTTFTTDCRRCPRLAAFLADIRQSHPDYHARPVPSFGPEGAPVLIVGLAPGFHGANRTGRPFTGDYAGILLYATLHKFGLADRPMSESAQDDLRLTGCRITNAVRCVPPQNKPETGEVKLCNSYLAEELAAVPKDGRILALGSVAHQAVLRALGLKAKDYPFGHDVAHTLPNGLRLFDSYHCSRYNTQTRRLTTAMFETVVQRLVTA